MRYRGPKDRVDAARSANTPIAELSELAKSEYTFVKEAVAENPNTPTDVLVRLLPDVVADDNDWQILLGMLRNRKLPEHLFATISLRLMAKISSITPRDYYPTLVVETLARSSTVPHDVVAQLANDAIVPKHLRSRVATSASNVHLLKMLASDSSEKVRARAIKALKTIEQAD